MSETIQPDLMLGAFDPVFTVTPKIQRQLKAVERTSGFLDAVRLKPDWIEDVRSQSQVREALDSIQIEGNSLTLTQAFELADRVDRDGLTDTEREFCNYLAAFEAIDGLRNERDEVLRLGDLQNIHRILVDGVRGGSRFAGQLRREEVVVGDREGEETVIHHAPPPWPRVEEELERLLTWIEATKSHGSRKGEVDRWVHPVIQAGIVQHRLVWIHPFVDGNGRTARMFTTLLLCQRGYDFKNLFQLSSHYNKNREAYYAALRTADQSRDYTAWLNYFLGGFSYQMFAIQERARKGAADAGV